MGSAKSKQTNEKFEDNVGECKWKKYRKVGLILLIVIALIGAYFLYTKYGAPKTMIGIDLPRLGLPEAIPDMVILPDVIKL